MPETTVIIPMGRGYNRKGDEPDRDAKTRCDKAITIYNKMLVAQSTAILGFGPGREGRRRHGLTMAEVMYEYVRRQAGDVKVIVNTNDDKAYGSLRELAWVIKQAVTLYGEKVRFIVVTAHRHDRRMEFIADKFFPGVDIKVVTSDDQPIPLWYEYCLAYPKLRLILFLRLLGLDGEEIIEAFRRYVTNPLRSD